MSAFEKGWRAFKVAVYAIGILFFLLVALAFYFKKDAPVKTPVAVRMDPPPPVAGNDPPPPSVPPWSVAPSSPPPPATPKAGPQAGPSFVERLDRADYRTLPKLLFDGVLHGSDDEARQAVEWLMPRRFRGEVPYLYFLGMYLAKQGSVANKTEGLEYILTGALVYRIDAAKCGDPTANQAVPVLESAMGLEKVREDLRERRPMFRKLVVAKALLNEIQSGPRPRPVWICAHGLRRGQPP